jgi:spore cortex formation protein SpoVR/YcgB (stage V sporulation)
LFNLLDDPGEPTLLVEAIHNERGYRRIRSALARSYDLGHADPQIEVATVDLAGDRRLIIHHKVQDGGLLAEKEARSVLRHIATLWGYDVRLQEVDASGRVLKEHNASPPQ